MDGIQAVKVLLAFLENMDCSTIMESIMGKLLGELHLATNNKKTPKDYIYFIL
jgi:hypothetical protein